VFQNPDVVLFQTGIQLSLTWGKPKTIALYNATGLFFVLILHKRGSLSPLSHSLLSLPYHLVDQLLLSSLSSFSSFSFTNIKIHSSLSPSVVSVWIQFSSTMMDPVVSFDFFFLDGISSRQCTSEGKV
jgi:hypothetical protein